MVRRDCLEAMGVGLKVGGVPHDSLGLLQCGVVVQDACEEVVVDRVEDVAASEGVLDAEVGQATAELGVGLP